MGLLNVLDGDLQAGCFGQGVMAKIVQQGVGVFQFAKGVSAKYRGKFTLVVQLRMKVIRPTLQ